MALVSCDLLDDEHLAVTGRGDSVGRSFGQGSEYFASEEGAEGGVITERQFDFLEDYFVEIAVGRVDWFSKHFWDLHFSYHLRLLAKRRFQLILG